MFHHESFRTTVESSACINTPADKRHAGLAHVALPYAYQAPRRQNHRVSIMNIIHDFHENDSLDFSITTPYITYQAVG
jgi:hypothetical protein